MIPQLQRPVHLTDMDELSPPRRTSGLGALCATTPRPADRVVIARRLGDGGVAFTADPGGWATPASTPLDQPVAADHPGADGADAVWFADRLSVWTTLADRALSGAACSEWFWPLAAHGWEPSMSRAETTRLAAHRAFELRGLTGTLQFAAGVVHHGTGAALVETMDPGVVLGWLVEIIPAAASPSLPDKRSRRRLRRELALPSPWRELMATIAERHTTRDPRVVWMLAAAVLDSATSPVLTPEFGLRVALGMRERVWEGDPLEALNEAAE